MGTNVSTIYISCPSGDKQTLGIKLPFLVMIIKNLKKYFSFEVQVPVVFVWMRDAIASVEEEERRQAAERLVETSSTASSQPVE